MQKNSQNPWKNPKNQPEKQPSPFFLALLLTGLLALEMYPGLVQMANADSSQILPHPHSEGTRGLMQKDFDRASGISEDSDRDIFPVALLVSFERSPIQAPVKMLNLTTIDDDLAQNNPNNANKLPPQVATTIRQNLSKQTNIPVEKLKITAFSSQTWPNTCLGLPKSGELCGQMMVEGWRVVLSDGSKIWIYRSDLKGKILRIENQVS